VSRTGTRSASSAGSPAISVRASRRPAAAGAAPDRPGPALSAGRRHRGPYHPGTPRPGRGPDAVPEPGRPAEDRPGLTDAQRAGIAAYETLIAQLRQVNSDVLAVAAGLSHGTIETVLAKSDLQLGVEALRGGRPRSGPVWAHAIEGL